MSNQTGFVYSDKNNIIDIRLDGKPLSIRELTTFAEQMRVELYKFGLIVRVEQSCNNAPVNHNEGDTMTKRKGKRGSGTKK